MGGGFKTKDLFFYRIKFYKRFRILSKYLPKKSKILCAGARQGTEVEVLRDLGYNSAYGVDLNPGPNNELVEYGDFMKLNLPNESLTLHRGLWPAKVDVLKLGFQNWRNTIDLDRIII